jgi:hypothetical protein
MKNVKIFKSDEEFGDLIVEEFKGSSMASLNYTSKVKTLKKSKFDKSIKFGDVFPDGDIYFTAKHLTSIGTDYEKAVNNQRAREGKETDFKAAGLPYGNYVADSKVLIEYTLKSGEKKLYVRTYKHKNSKVDGVYHFEDGKELTEEQVLLMQQFISDKSSKSKTQNLEKEIEPKNFTVAGIVTLSAGGNCYVREGYEYLLED